MRSLALVLALGGCFYSPGSYRDMMHPMSGRRVELACLDFAVTLTQDEVAKSGPIVAYSFGNRCYGRTTVDLSSIHAVARYPDGTQHDLRATDPKHEIRALRLDGLWQGHEEIEYVDPQGGTITSLCLELGHIGRRADDRDRWMCFGPGGIPLPPDSQSAPADQGPPGAMNGSAL